MSKDYCIENSVLTGNDLDESMFCAGRLDEDGDGQTDGGKDSCQARLTQTNCTIYFCFLWSFCSRAIPVDQLFVLKMEFHFCPVLFHGASVVLTKVRQASMQMFRLGLNFYSWMIHNFFVKRNFSLSKLGQWVFSLQLRLVLLRSTIIQVHNAICMLIALFHF